MILERPPTPGAVRCIASTDVERDFQGALTRDATIDLWAWRLVPASLRLILNAVASSPGSATAAGFSVTRSMRRILGSRAGTPHQEDAVSSLPAQYFNLRTFDQLLADEDFDPLQTGDSAAWWSMAVEVFSAGLLLVKARQPTTYSEDSRPVQLLDIGPTILTHLGATPKGYVGIPISAVHAGREVVFYAHGRDTRDFGGKTVQVPSDSRGGGGSSRTSLLCGKNPLRAPIPEFPGPPLLRPSNGCCCTASALDTP